jgi:hypothetical protein
MEFSANEICSEVCMRSDDDDSLRALRNLSSVTWDQGYFLHKYSAVANSQNSLFSNEFEVSISVPFQEHQGNDYISQKSK